MLNWELLFYKMSSGRVPVEEYILNLQPGDRAKVVQSLSTLEENGIRLGMPHVRRLTGSPLWELRIRGRVHHRIFYVTITGRRILLLHAFEKKTQATPNREIQTAEGRLAEYQGRLN